MRSKSILVGIGGVVLGVVSTHASQAEVRAAPAPSQIQISVQQQALAAAVNPAAAYIFEVQSTAAPHSQSRTGQNWTISAYNATKSEITAHVHETKLFQLFDLELKLQPQAKTNLTTELFYTAQCETPEIAELRLQAAAGGVDQAKHHFKHPPPTYQPGPTDFPITAGVSPQGEWIQFTSAAIEGGYACGKKVKVKAHIVNHTSITPHHASVKLLDQAPAGTSPEMGGDEVLLGEAPLTINAKGEADVVVESTKNVSGRDGRLTLKIADSTSELDGHLYRRWAGVFVYETTLGVWQKID